MTFIHAANCKRVLSLRPMTCCKKWSPGSKCEMIYCNRAGHRKSSPLVYVSSWASLSGLERMDATGISEELGDTWNENGDSDPGMKIAWRPSPAAGSRTPVL